MLHHPLLAAGAAWWALLGVTVRLDFGSLIVGVLPTLAVIVNFQLSKRQKTQIAVASTEKIGEVHDLVNHQRDELKAEILTLRTEVDTLHERLALSTPPKGG